MINIRNELTFWHVNLDWEGKAKPVYKGNWVLVTNVYQNKEIAVSHLQIIFLGIKGNTLHVPKRVMFVKTPFVLKKNHVSEVGINENWWLIKGFTFIQLTKKKSCGLNKHCSSFEMKGAENLVMIEIDFISPNDLILWWTIQATIVWVTLKEEFLLKTLLLQILATLSYIED